MSAKAPAKGHTAKHAASSKNNSKHATSSGKSGTKHTPAKQKQPATAKSKGQAQVHAKGTQAKPAKPAGFAAGDLLPVCSFEAVAVKLRLLGVRIHDDDVAQLWSLAGEREASIPEAAAAFGLTVRPASPYESGVLLHVDIPGPHAVLATEHGWWSWGELLTPWPCTISEAWAVTLP